MNCTHTPSETVVQFGEYLDHLQAVSALMAAWEDGGSPNVITVLA